MVNHVVFADPDNRDARTLQADALEQLGYQSESGPWRNFYLSAAGELRGGVKDLPAPNTASPNMVRSMGMALFFDYLGMRLTGRRAADRRSTLVCVLPDLDETWTLLLRHGTLSHRLGADPEADATITINRSDLDAVILGQARLSDHLEGGRATIEGDERALHELIDLLDEFEFWFNIVTP